MSDCPRCVRREQFHDRFFCAVCGREGSDDYMVHDSVWFAARLNKKQFACLDCLEHRLGRQITLDDLTPARINNILRLMYERGQAKVVDDE